MFATDLWLSMRLVQVVCTSAALLQEYEPSLRVQHYPDLELGINKRP
jgi:hypothetical protein